MNITRRDFLGIGLKTLAAASLPLSLEFLGPEEVKAVIEKSKVRWGFLVDTFKCVGCGVCVKACKLENEVPYDAPVTRTWVERYVVLKDGRVLADTPNGARDGFIDKKIGGEEIDEKDIAKGFFVPKLCNQCDKPPCVQVCPVGATYQTAEGIVLVDRKWCIGCGYCIMACPYGVRFFHPVHRVAEKCTFCNHRLAKGMKTACVDACPFDAREVCNLKDPNDPITEVITTRRVAVLRDEYGTDPQVFYLGLDERVR